jgi:hypothetical protein
LKLQFSNAKKTKQMSRPGQQITSGHRPVRDGILVEKARLTRHPSRQGRNVLPKTRIPSLTGRKHRWGLPVSTGILSLPGQISNRYMFNFFIS